MNNKILIWILVMVMLVSTASANKLWEDDGEDVSRTAYWTTSSGNRNDTIYVSPTHSIEFSTSGTAGELENSSMSFTNDIVVLQWSMQHTGGAYANPSYIQLRSGATARVNIEGTGAGSGLEISNGVGWVAIPNADWRNNWLTMRVEYSVSTGKCDVFVNGTLEMDDQTCASTGTVNTIDFNQQGGADTTFLIDDVLVCDGNTSDCVIGGSGAGSTISLFNPSILNNTQYDYTDIDFNVTMNATNITTCSLYLNSVLNDSNIYSAGNDTSVSYTKTLNEGTQTYSINCTDSINNVSIGTYTFYIDTIEPRVIHNFINNSLYYLQNITFDLNITDNESIFSYNVSIDGVTGQYKDNILQTSYNASISLDITGLNAGDHILNIKASDGHTAKKLKGDYKFNNGLLNDYAKYSFEDIYSEGEIMIYQKDGSIFDSWSSEKKTDRYSFKFKPNTKKTSYTFVIEAEGDISIVELPHTKYQQWLIYQDHWLDFMPYTDVNFKRLDTNQVEVTVRGIDPNLAEIEFNSIGDLNTVELNYSFTTINLTETFESPIVSNNPTTLTLKINNTNQQGDIFSTLLEWDGTNYTAVYDGIVSNITTYSYDLTIPGVATIINKTHNWWIETTGYEPTPLQNQTVYPVNLALCDATHTNPVLNVTYRDEVDDAILNVTNAYSMKFTDNINWTNISNTYTGTTIGFCTDLPDDITYNWNVHGNFNMQRAGYVNRFYTIDEGSPLGVSNNPGKNLTLYLVKINESSTVTYTWRTSTYTPIDGILRIYHCDLDGTKNLVESLQITSGTAVGNIVLFTEQYAYEVIYEGDVYNNEGVGWGTCHIESATEASYMIDVGAVTIIQPVGMSSIRCSLDKTSNTTVEMTWNQNEEDSTYVSGCISAYRQDIYGSILVYENCSESGYSLEVSVPTSGYDYIIQGELKQGNYTVGCRDSVSFNFAEFGGSIFGNISTLIAVFFLVAALILFYAGEGELMIGAAIVGVVLSWIIGILFLPWLEVTAMIAFLVVIVLVGRNTR